MMPAVANRVGREAYEFGKFSDPGFVDSILDNNLRAVILEGRFLLKPPPDIVVSEWADRNIVLPETSAAPGRYRTSRAPHSRMIMNCACNIAIRQLSIMGSSQIAKTQILLNIIGYYMDIDPCHIMLMQPTDMDARDFSNQKLDPMIQDTTVLKQKVAKTRTKDKDNTILRKRFIGGYLTIVAGTSPRATRQRSARITIGDDIDGIELNVKEGDPVARLIKRSTTFADALNINASTPTLEGSSRIAALYAQSNMMKYYVRCPHCQVQQYLKWENLTWDKDHDAFGKVTKNYVKTVKYACEGCGTLLTEGERIEMLGLGEWIADRPWVTDHYGFWINELSSTLSTMEKVAQAIVDAGDDDTKLEALYNTVFGLTYKKTAGKEMDPLELMSRVEDFIDVQDLKIPNEVLYLTGGVDLQEGTKEKPQRLEVEVWGWGKNKERWLIYKTVIPGNLKNNAETWDKLDLLWEQTWYRADGVPLKISVKFVDSGDDSQTVYDYVRGREDESLYAIKGSNKYGAPSIPKKFSPVDKGRVNLLIIGTQIIKKEIFTCFTKIKAKGKKYTHFPHAFCDAEYFRQLTAEHEVVKYIGTLSYSIFVPKKRGIANECLDLYVYNYAAQELKNPNYDSIYDDIEKFKAEKKEEEEKQEEVEVETNNIPNNNNPFNRRGKNFVNNY